MPSYYSDFPIKEDMAVLDPFGNTSNLTFSELQQWLQMNGGYIDKSGKPVGVIQNEDGTFDWNNLPIDPAGTEMKRLVEEQTNELDWVSFVGHEWPSVQHLS